MNNGTMTTYADDDLSIIGTGMRIMGDLIGTSPIRVCGSVEGDVWAPAVTVDRGGTVVGSVRTAVAAIHGVVHGPIEAIDVTIGSTASIAGSVIHNTLTVEPGAHVAGQRPWRPLAFLERQLGLEQQATTAAAQSR